MMPSPPIHQPSDARHSGWLSARTTPLTAGQQIGPQLHRQPCPATPALFVQPVAHTHPMGQSDWGGRFDPTSPNLTPRLNPHRARGTDGAPSFPRFRASALFRRRSSNLWPASSSPASQNLHNAQFRSFPLSPRNGEVSTLGCRDFHTKLASVFSPPKKRGLPAEQMKSPMIDTPLCPA